MMSTLAWPDSASASTTITLAPRSAKPSAVARPMPPPPPVISATLPVKSIRRFLRLFRRPCSDAASSARSPPGCNQVRPERCRYARPLSGEALRMLQGVRLSSIGWPTTSTSPSTLCGTTRVMPDASPADRRTPHSSCRSAPTARPPCSAPRSSRRRSCARVIAPIASFSASRFSERARPVAIQRIGGQMLGAPAPCTGAGRCRRRRRRC